jgi:parallel beta-helix repeat protein
MKLLIEKEKEEVGNKIFPGIMLTLLLTSMSTLALNIQSVEASETIYIRANGSVEPSTANITSVDNITYTFTGNIYDSIVTERDNIVVDGTGYTVQGTGSGKGIDLSGRNNVTIRNMKIGAFFDYGIHLYGSSDSSIIGNSIINNTNGIWLEESSNNTLRDNSMRGNIYNFGVFGSELSHFINDVDSSNTVDGKLVYYWVDRSDEVVPSDAGYVAVVNSTGITVKNLDLKNNEQGILTTLQ